MLMTFHHHRVNHSPDALVSQIVRYFSGRVYAYMPDNLHLFRNTLLKLIKSENLPYQTLTA